MEDEEPPESYHVDWVKGKGAGRKANKGRPPRQDMTLMTADEAEEAIRKWEKDWKRDRDKLHRKSHSGHTLEGCSFVDGSTGYTRCITQTLQPMVEVTNAPLLEGHTFPDKEIVLMRIVEEANLYGVRIKIIRSDGLQVDARGLNGDPFHFVAYYGTTAFRWMVTKCITWNGRLAYVPVLKGQKKGAGKGKDEDHDIPPLNFSDLPPPPPNEAVGDAFEDTLCGLEEGNPDKGPIPMETEIPVEMAKKPRNKSPIKAKWIVPLVHLAIADAPNLSCKEIMILLQPYIIDMFLTNALIQKVWTTVRNKVFDDPDKNVTYLPELVDILEAAGHDFDIYAKTPIDVKKHLLAVVLEQKMNSLKKEQDDDEG